MRLILAKQIQEPAAKLLQQTIEFMGLKTNLNYISGGYELSITEGLHAGVKLERFTALEVVESVEPFTKEYKLASRQYQSNDTLIKIGKGYIGGEHLTVMAGPCAIESEASIQEIAAAVGKAGATVLRGGAFKPRTSPYSFQGMGEEGLRYMQSAAKNVGLATISEAVCLDSLQLVARYMDVVQIGARNMQNFELLKACGALNKPILLKRGMTATYKEFLLAAEYILAHGNPNVILCERGIRTFETTTRNTLDLSAVPVLSGLSHLPIIVDPSHGVGIREHIAPMARAAVSAGANGLIIESHVRPNQALSDAAQTISIETLQQIIEDARLLSRMNQRDQKCRTYA